MESQPRFFVSADWSKDPGKRSVYVADLSERLIYRETRPDWALGSLMALARQLSEQGSTLVGVDLVLGVPRSYWELVLAEPRYGQPSTFIDWLGQLGDNREFFDPTNVVKDHEQWRVDRPWFHVPRGQGGLTSFTQKVCDGFLRRIDRATDAKPVFAVSGMPGVVGYGTRDFWQELAACLASDRDFAVWPFDGPLSELLRTNGVVLAETYPGLAYAAALADELPTERFAVGKTKPDQRQYACDLLADAAWVNVHDVDLGDLAPARNDEDDFDAHVTAAAVLRCHLEGTALADQDWIDTDVEGSMLLAGPVDPNRKSKALATPEKLPIQKDLRGPRHPPTRKRTEYPCPIPGCSKIFHGSRGGWDAHVEYLRIHPCWRPDVSSREERKALFRQEHGEWLR